MRSGIVNVMTHCVVFSTVACTTPVVAFAYVALMKLLLHVGGSGLSELLEFLWKCIVTRLEGISAAGSGNRGAWSQQFV